MRTPEDREKARERCHELLGRMRVDPLVATAQFELDELIVARLDRLELGGLPPEETPTAPGKRAGRPSARPTKPSLRVPTPSPFRVAGEILTEARRKP